MGETMEPLTLDEAFEMCMELWDVLSRLDDCTNVNISMKGKILTEVLGYRECSCGCPFCQYTRDVNDICGSCPIILYNERLGCGECAYNDWCDEMFFNNKHFRKKASAFFNFLCTIYEKHYGKPYGE